MATVYLAGPEVFLPGAAAIGARKKALCRAAGFEGLFPSDTKPPQLGPDAAIFATCVAAMRQADLGIFNLTPFRGPSADVGTVWELGFMVALGKPVWAYTNDPAPLRARIPGTRQGQDGMWRDPEGRLTEDFNNADNLMIDRSLPPGGLIRLDRGARLDDLDGFLMCLDAAKRARDGSVQK